MRKNNEITIGEALNEFLLSDKVRDKYIKVRIKSLWRDLLGPMIDGHTTQLVYFKGILSVTIDSAPLKHELTYGVEKLRSLINEALPFPAIKEIRIR